MLKHEASPETQSPPAAQVRVTPEELAAAISRIEARKDVSQRSLDGTIAIGEAVEQLGLDTTPEEVLAEVQAGRQGPKQKRDFRALACAGACVAALASVAFTSLSPSLSTQPSPSAQPLQIDQRQLTVLDNSGKQVFATEIGNNQVFRCRLGGETLTASDYQSNSTWPAWTLVKHDGKIYVRGWMPRVSNKVLEVEGTDVVNYHDAHYPIPITLPVDGFKAAPTIGAEDNETSFFATNIHLDAHAYEKWQP